MGSEGIGYNGGMLAMESQRKRFQFGQRYNITAAPPHTVVLVWGAAGSRKWSMGIFNGGKWRNPTNGEELPFEPEFWCPGPLEG
jgi:hypothetical protein